MTEERTRSGIEPALDEATVARQWRAIERGERRAVVRSRVLAGGAVAIPAAAVLAIYLASGPSETALEARETSLVHTLDEGTRIELAERSKCIVRTSGEETAVELERGVVDFDVAHRADRVFLVRAGEVVVRVIGTAFRVERGAGVAVEVRRGVVEVSHDRVRVRVRAGERWPIEVREQPREPEEPREPETPIVDPRPTEPSIEPDEEAPPPVRDPPEALFADALAAKRDGRTADALERFDRFVATYPSNPRAGLAHYEAGRTRMELGGWREAASSLERALRARGSGAYAEDARARLVEIRARLGDRAGCAQALERYLASHPSGPNAERLRNLCGVR
jgi:tetratricopeptide (TPR) repeat protein